MKKKKTRTLELRKNSISNLKLLHHGIVGGQEVSETLTDTFVTTFPSGLLTQNCGETENCETEHNSCNTNDTTKSLGVPPSFDCNVVGSLVTC